MYIIAETLGNLFKWCSKDELICENIESLYDYSSGTITIHDKISDEDMNKLLHPKDKTFGYIFVRCYDGDFNPGTPPIPPIYDYAIPFNDEAINILNKYSIMSVGSSWRSNNQITVIDLDGMYVGDNKVEKYSYYNYRKETNTLRIALFTLKGEQLEWLLSKIKDITGYSITVAGEIQNEMTDALQLVLKNAKSWETVLEDILTGRLGVVKLESSW